MRYLAVALLALVGFGGEAKAFLKVCNESDEDVFVAVGYKDGESWIAQGWWSVEAGGCSNVIEGNLKTRFYYIRAEGVNGRVWSGEHSFCTTDKKFMLADSPDCVSETVDRESFFEVDTGESLEWTATLTDD